MRDKEKRRSFFEGHRRSAALAVLMSLVLIPNVGAFEFKLKGIEGSFDTTLSFGASWRLDDRDPGLIGIANGGTRTGVNSDDGDLNYDTGIVSAPLKMTSELDLHGRHFGVFARGTAFYDYVNMDKDRARTPLTPEAERRVGKNAELLDAFVWTSFNLGQVPVQARLGEQVVNWGESVFFRGGISVINPVNAAAIRLPGSELKEALLPEGMFWTSIGITENISVEGLYLYSWEGNRADPPGTYFSTNDYVGEGGAFVMLGNGMIPEGTPPYALPRSKDIKAGSSDQYGIAGRFVIPKWNYTEFGLYYLKYHSRFPLISGYAATNPRPDSGSYVIEYPEDIELYGLSFSTEIPWGGLGWQGEVSYKKDLPLQIDDDQILRRALGMPSQIPGPFVPGEYVQGYIRRDAMQAQTALTKVFGPTLGADKMTVIGEVAMRYIYDLPDQKTELTLEHPKGREVGTTAWGYRLRGKLDFFNFIGAFTFTPRVAWRQDVSGNAPGPGGSFLADRKSILIGANFSYQSTWVLGVSYANFFGAESLNKINDRDLISAMVKYSF